MKKGLLGPDPGHYYYKLFFRRLPPPGQSGQPERRGERSLPHRPAIKGRRPTETSEARFRAHRKCTYHLGFSLGELRGLEAKFRTALADETAQIDQDFTGHENGESSELRALINRASRGAEFGPAFAALAAGRNMPDGAMSELQVHRGLPGYLLPLDVVMPTLCSKGASWQNIRDLQAVSATDFPFSGSSYHSCYHSGSSRHQFQTSLLLRLHQSIPPL